MSSFHKRKGLLNKIAKARSSSVISYITGDRRQLETQISPEVIDIFVEHLDDIGPTKRISLVLYTLGGNTAAAWRLINLLHTFCDELEVIIPSKALSAGTLISLGATKIIMTKQAALGPIDPSINHPLNPLIPGSQARSPVSVEAVRGYLDAAKELGIDNGESATKLLVDLSNKVHPLVLGEIFRSQSQIRFLAKKLLKKQVKDEKKIDAIIDFLCAESGSHDYTINRREARELGLNIENPSDSFYSILRELHLSYVNEFKLLEPFDPWNLFPSEHLTVDYRLPRAAIESCKTGSHQYISEGTLSKNPAGQETPDPNRVVNDRRNFEGWRKI
ncbi:hypothetical protein [Nitrosovibrio sp. Nv17]|uniref:SDH family Clp fold serine proteinase n=1 Tax=Nitrosovibrio sp. Nv17 TaxID=1855339 RepID=UPI000908953B|nr:hypothetical protein [Nitrosovibrio sp. Nv17]SFW19116.1 serine protease, ClpP class [Nitrosovibrio sp. Nv17]